VSFALSGHLSWLKQQILMQTTLIVSAKAIPSGLPFKKISMMTHYWHKTTVTSLARNTNQIIVG
jgi:hypothetical protein